MKTVRVSLRWPSCMFALAAATGILTISSCGGGSSSNSSSTTQTITPPAQNVQPIVVDGGPIPGQIYPDGAFTSVTICVPGTTTCQTISGVLVDTGSFGLRLASSVVTIPLPQQTAAGGAVGECTQFADGSFLWGPVANADVKMAGEVAGNVGVSLMEHGFFTIPPDCSSGGGLEEDDPTALGANGILGVGYFGDDCGAFCTSAGSSPPPTGLYYNCSTSGCQSAFESEALQVTNPVSLFATDNNGVIVELPAVSGQAPGVSGSLVFGIGTQSNNGLGSATVLTVDQNGNISTTFKSNNTPDGFIDSGSNGIFFFDSTITGFPACTTSTGFYCPTTPQSLTATNQGANGKTTSVSFGVGNADQLFASSNDPAFSTLAGPNANAFDWGLPFFFGRNVYTAILGKSTPGGPGPYWAY